MLHAAQHALLQEGCTSTKPWSSSRQCLQYGLLVSGRELQVETLNLLCLGFLIVVGTLRCAIDIHRLVCTYMADGLSSDKLVGGTAELNFVPIAQLV
jgi:hypothetical protein